MVCGVYGVETHPLTDTHSLHPWCTLMASERVFAMGGCLSTPYIPYKMIKVVVFVELPTIWLYGKLYGKWF